MCDAVQQQDNNVQAKQRHPPSVMLQPPDPTCYDDNVIKDDCGALLTPVNENDNNLINGVKGYSTAAASAMTSSFTTTLTTTTNQNEAQANNDCLLVDHNGYINDAYHTYENEEEESMLMTSLGGLDESEELWAPVTQMLSGHSSYALAFRRNISAIFYGDGPLPFHYRHYLAIMAASRHRCQFLLDLHKSEFLRCGGSETWLSGTGDYEKFENVQKETAKLRDLDFLNKILAHQPWTIQSSHLQTLLDVSSPNNWSLSELVHGLLILSHVHAFCSFVFACGIKYSPSPTNSNNLSPLSPPLSKNRATAAAAEPTKTPPTTISSVLKEKVTSSSTNPIAIKKPPPSIAIDDAGGVENNAAYDDNESSGGIGRKSQVSPQRRGHVSPPVDARDRHQAACVLGQATAAKKSRDSPTPLRSPPTNQERDNNVEQLMQRMRELAQKTTVPSSLEDRLRHFLDTIDAHTGEANFDDALLPLLNSSGGTVVVNATTKNQESANTGTGTIDDESIKKFVENSLTSSLFSIYTQDLPFSYTDFFKRADPTSCPTFKIHDFSWEDQGYCIINQFCNLFSNVVDDKFRLIQTLTYNFIGHHENVDTSKYRTAVWNYIQSLYGIRHDDYDYSEVNRLLSRQMKLFVKTTGCYPERMTNALRASVMVDFQHSEKVHVNLLIFESRFQAELLYLLRALTRFFNF